MHHTPHHHHLKVAVAGVFPPPEGGTTVLLKHLANYLNTTNIFDVDIVRLNGFERGAGKLTRNIITDMLRLTYAFVKNNVVTVHLSPRGAIVTLPLILCLSAIFRRTWLLRLFGGDADQWFNGHSWRGRFSLRLIRFCPVLLVETHALKEYFDNNGANYCVWFPNARPMPRPQLAAPTTRVRKAKVRRFVFIGRVTESKGVLQAIEAISTIGKGVALTIFGPIEDGLPDELPWNVTYAGIIQSDMVITTLKDYDCLLLPTFYPGEGYPGVIIEALSIGVPVISTRWRAIPELLNVRPWMLCEPRSVPSLINSIYSLDQALTHEAEALECDCLTAASQFSAERWSNIFAELCVSLSDKKGQVI